MTRKIDTETTPSLLIRLRDHEDSQAWQVFTEIYAPLIYDFCRLRGLQPEDSADVSQEALVRIARAIRNFDYDPSTGLFRDWVARIVTNEVKRHFATQKKISPLAEDFDAPGSTDVWNEHFHQRIMQAALSRCEAKFTKETWTLFERSWIERIPSDQVAKDCSVGIEKVYVARSRVLKQLRQEVASLADEAL